MGARVQHELTRKKPTGATVMPMTQGIMDTRMITSITPVTTLSLDLWGSPVDFQRLSV
jgi:hypothetical protein